MGIYCEDMKKGRFLLKGPRDQGLLFFFFKYVLNSLLGHFEWLTKI